MAFTSISYQKDSRLGLRANYGIQCFQIHGELYHFAGPVNLSSQQEEAPKFAQLWFYDPEFATAARAQQAKDLDPTILQDLHYLLHEYNPFIGFYKTARERIAAQSGPLRILLNPQMRLIMESGADRRRENLPTSNEIAAILLDEFDGEGTTREVILAAREPGRYGQELLSKVHVTHASYMPLHYVLLFPHGDYGWHYGMELLDRQNVRKNLRLGQRTYYRYRLHVRDGEFPTLFRSCRLFQQYLVDAYAACEQTALNWFRTHQKDFRADLYKGLTDSLLRQDVDLTEIGKRLVLPASFTGSDRNMQQHFQDSMAIVRHFGKPSLFITFTANPHWPEIVRELYDGQTAADRPDLVARVFHLKVEELIRDVKRGIFGVYAGHCYTIEYQKRGLPHLHLLLFIENESFNTPGIVDEIVCAELPDLAWDPTGELTEIVLAQMTHGPCGQDNPDAPCMARKNASGPPSCSKRFPKAFQETTRIQEDGYPEYRRRNNGRTFTVKKPNCPGEEVVRDNRWVVPYSPYLLQRYRSHINVEVCATIRAVKYIHKYVYKGVDRTTVAVENTGDEITRYLQGRYLGPTEAFWRLFEYPTHEEFPPVQHLAVHLKGEQPVYFPEDLDKETLQARMEKSKSTLMAFFDYNKAHQDGPKYLYSEFPTYFVFNKGSRKWHCRQKGRCIGRMYHCSPIAGERYYLRALLTVVRAPTCFADLLMYRGVRYDSYHAACVARGLAENDQEWFNCFDEAILFAGGRGLRTLFLTGLRFRHIADPLAIWEQYKDEMCYDLLRTLQRGQMDFPLPLLRPELDYGLFLLGRGLADQQKGLKDFKLPLPVWDWGRAHDRATNQHDPIAETALAVKMQSQLNTDQLSCFNTIVTAIADDPQTAQFYLQGPGGTGKTFLYKTLCHYYRGLGTSVLCVASTGIAALLLPSGQTSHSQFKIPIDLHEASTCNVSKNSALAQVLKRVGLIIWDEVPMQHKYCFEAVHRLLTDLRSTSDDILFGGIPAILGGDFAQILPVVVNGSRADIVQACLQRSFVWPLLKRLYLRTNMRVRNGPFDPQFVNWLGQLSFDPTLNGLITLPLFVSQPDTIEGLIQHIYPADVVQAATGNPSTRDPDVFRGRGILTTLNTTVSALNTSILDQFPGVEQTYQSVDSADCNNTAEGIDMLPLEHLQSIDLPNLPLSTLRLKIGVPVMLLRNLCPQEGLCNGTRMVVTGLRSYCIKVRLLGGDFHGEFRTIPRIRLSSSNEGLTFTLTRKQFPVRLCFAMTINKSQGQSFETVGIDLRTPAFSHGQFYVAVSRTSSVASLHVLMTNQETRTTSNIIYPEVLETINGLQ